MVASLAAATLMLDGARGVTIGGAEVKAYPFGLDGTLAAREAAAAL
ncbi:MAG: hypothetical protein WA418_07420 [Bradyrhizobium sp.]